MINPDELTPVQCIRGLYLKREDLFAPFSYSQVNGGKLRQCLKLVEHIKDKYKGVVSCCSIHSPQAPITASVAKYFGMECYIMYGGTTIENTCKMEMPRIVLENGGRVVISSKSGIHKILYMHAKKFAEKENLFVVDYGFNIIDYPDLMISAVGNQVENIPDELDNLVVTCGSGITTIGILTGVKKFNKHVKKFYFVATAPSRKEKIDKALKELNLEIDYEIIDLFHSKGFRYEKEQIEYFNGIELHPNYEAKTFNWLKNHINWKYEKTLFWIVGKKPRPLKTISNIKN